VRVSIHARILAALTALALSSVAALRGACVVLDERDVRRRAA
jgi:hypothetical protein